MSLVWKYGAGALAFLCIMLGIRLYMETRHSAKLQVQVTKLSDQLRALEKEGAAKVEQSGRNITQANEKIVYVDRYVRPLENKPLPPNCATPDKAEWGNVL